jgi:hypothetical protein
MKYAVIRDDAIVRFYNARRDLDPSEIKREGGKPLLRPVRVEGFDRSFDPEIFERRGPRFTVTETEVIEEYWLAFRADARKAMLDKIDDRAEKERARVVATIAGEVLELEETLREAKAALSLPPAEPIDPGDFPFLAADVDNTINPETDRRGGARSEGGWPDRRLRLLGHQGCEGGGRRSIRALHIPDARTMEGGFQGRRPAPPRVARSRRRDPGLL